jgi:hypothetical protein
MNLAMALGNVTFHMTVLVLLVTFRAAKTHRIAPRLRHTLNSSPPLCLPHSSISRLRLSRLNDDTTLSPHQRMTSG